MKNIYKIYAIAISSFLLFNLSLNTKNCDSQWIPLNYDFTGSSAKGLSSIGSKVFVSSNVSGILTNFTTFKQSILLQTQDRELCRHEKDVDDYIIESIVF